MSQFRKVFSHLFWCGIIQARKVALFAEKTGRLIGSMDG